MELITFDKKLVKKYYLKHHRGEKLSAEEAILTYCYDCMGCYKEGSCDCQVESCPLYPFMAKYRVFIKKEA